MRDVVFGLGFSRFLYLLRSAHLTDISISGADTTTFFGEWKRKQPVSFTMSFVV